MVPKESAENSGGRPRYVVDENGILVKESAWRSSVASESSPHSPDVQDGPEAEIHGDFHSTVDDAKTVTLRCAVCTAEFYTKVRLDRHMRKHSGQPHSGPTPAPKSKRGKGRIPNLASLMQPSFR